jgi:hypothetical protein
MKTFKSTASKVFNVPLEEVTREQRSHAKNSKILELYMGFRLLTSQTKRTFLAQKARL